ncbi:phage portal protein [Salisediminibacterium selenitireducens]|uniref:Phage portal protein, HK97 family n=1 Tax=Bacillus selenitireducens (strain ATCC 700615 / DSM 15326 / MLS10) TaxID=439292 RepID=D6XZE5_BACIE|nr:phage portal protein [Salisediminibacterium selenitireducens]ADH98319.1 phage portal protein, HK97 family [[Bacillus] selenitireducens MLS10]
MNIPFLNKLFPSRASPKNSLFGSTYSFFFGGSSSGKSVNETTAMQTTAVYACVRVLAETIASLPLHVYTHTDNGKDKAFDHPLYFMLHDEPNPEMTSFVFRETMVSHLLLWGNAYAQVIRDGRGQVLALYPLLPDRMTVDRNAKGQLFYEYRKDTGSVLLKPEEVLHIPGLGFDGLVGYSPVAMAKNAIGMAIATEEYGAKFFSNGANPGGVLQHPGVVKDPRKIRESWNSVYQGSSNAHRVAVLEEGMTFQSIGIPPDQAQFLETRKYQTEEICRIFRVPPHLVGNLDRATFSNIEHQSISFIDNTIMPWVSRLEQAMKRALLSPDEKKQYLIKFNLNGRLRGDAGSRAQFYQIMRQNGVMSANDIRELEEMNRIPDDEGGSKYLVNGNFVDMAKAGAWTGQYEDKQEREEENT